MRWKNVYSVERVFIKVISLWFTVDSTIGVKDLYMYNNLYSKKCDDAEHSSG